MTKLVAVANNQLSDASQLNQFVSLYQGGAVYDVANGYGATGNGVTDDTAAVQAAVAACKAGGGGTIYFPPGTYILNPNIPGVTNGIAGNVAIVQPSNSIIRGAGRSATTLRMKAAATVGGGSAAQLISNDSLASNLVVEDLTIDGNGANQTVPTNGIIWWRATNVKVSRVRFINVFTTAASEQGCMQTISSSFVVYRECDINQGGFGANALGFSGSLQCEVIACTARGVGPTGPWRVFFCDGSQNITWLDCHAYLNTTTVAAFDCNGSKYIKYLGCTAGSQGDVQWQSFPAPEPYEVFSQNLGNSGSGFALNNCAHIDVASCVSGQNAGRGLLVQGTSSHIRVLGGLYGGSTGANGYGIVLNGATVTDIVLDGCSCANNVQAGIQVVSAAGVNVIGCQCVSNGQHGLIGQTQTNLKVIGGLFQSNTSRGIQMFNATDAQQCRVSGGPVFGANTGADWGAAGSAFSAFGNVAAPAVPATTVALTSPFIFDADVYITPGASTCAVSIGGTATGVTLASSGVGQVFRVPAGQTVTLTYTAAPTWAWFLA